MKKIHLILIYVFATSCELVSSNHWKWSKHTISKEGYNFKSEKFQKFSTDFDYAKLETAKINLRTSINSNSSLSTIKSNYEKFVKLHNKLDGIYPFVMTNYYGEPVTYKEAYMRIVSVYNDDLTFNNEMLRLAATKGDDVKKYFFGTTDSTEIAKQLAGGETPEKAELSFRMTQLEDEMMNLTAQGNRDEEYVETSCDIYSEYAEIANEYAVLCGYSNYPEYAYKNVYARDYTPAQALSLANMIENSLGSVVGGFVNYFEDGYNGNYLYELLYGQFNGTKYDIGGLMDDYAEFLGDKYLKMYDHLWSDGYYYFSDNENSLGTAYVTSAPVVNDHIAFFSKDNQNMLAITHEFGHYFALQSESKNNYCSYDILETHSQGNEYTMLNYLQSKKGGATLKTLANYKVYEALLYLVEFAFITKVENYVYSYEYLTANQIHDYIENLTSEFASKGLMVSPGYWCYACVASSCYYISYATSLLESVQFLTMSINDAKKAYVDFCLDNITTGSVAKWKKAGLTSPFEQQTIDKLVNYCNAM